MRFVVSEERRVTVRSFVSGVNYTRFPFNSSFSRFDLHRFQFLNSRTLGVQYVDSSFQNIVPLGII